MNYQISVHEGECPIRPENGVAPGWVFQIGGLSLMSLRPEIRALREEGYEDSAVLVESV